MFRKCTRCTKLRCVCAPGSVRKVAFFPASARDFSSRARVSRINSKKPAGWYTMMMMMMMMIFLAAPNKRERLIPSAFFLSCNVLLSPVQCGFICYFDYYLCKTFTYQPVHRKSAHRSALPWRVTHFIPKKLHVYMCLSVCVCVCGFQRKIKWFTRNRVQSIFPYSLFVSPALP